MTEINHRILLRARPTGIPQPDNFVADSVPVRAPARGRGAAGDDLPVDRSGDAVMDERHGADSGEVMRGGGIARVLESRSAAFQPGELVQARLGWQTHPTVAGEISAEGRSYRAAMRWPGSVRSASAR